MPETPLQQIARTDVFREVLRRIEAYIESEGLEPGDRLPGDRKIAHDLGVSRPVVRQALKVLEGLGRVAAHQGVGTFVQDARQRIVVERMFAGLERSEHVAAELLAVREHIELAVLDGVLDRRDEAGLSAVRDALRSQGQSLRSTDQLDARLDLQFEGALGALCGNTVLMRVQKLLHEMWLELHLELDASREPRERFHQEHEGILRAIEEGDAAGARNQLRQHLRSLDGNSS